MLRAGGRKAALVGTVEYRIGDERATRAAYHSRGVGVESDLRARRRGGLYRGGDGSVVPRFGAAAGLRQCRSMLRFSPTLPATTSTITARMEEYFESKAILFQGSGTEPPRVAVINVEDEYGQRLVKLCDRQTDVHHLRNR